jgi:hypothetical protein
MSPDAPEAPETTTPSKPVTTPPAPVQSLQTEQFQTLKPARDVWGYIWKGVISLNFVIAVLFLLFVVLRLVGISNSEFQAGALGTPFWLLPVLLIAELAVAVVYGFMKRPKLSEVTSILMWLGIGLGVAFVCAIAFVVYASIG